MSSGIDRLARFVSKTASNFMLYHNTGQFGSSRQNSSALLRSFNDSPPVRMVVEKLSWLVGSTEWKMFRVRDSVLRNKIRKCSSGSSRARYLKEYFQKNQGEEVEVSFHPVLNALEFGNPIHSGDQVRGLIDTYLSLIGEAYVWVERRGLEYFLWPFPPTWITGVDTKKGIISLRNSFLDRDKLDVGEVLRFLVPSPDNPYSKGSGVVATLADEIDADEYAAKMVRSVFQNKGMVDMIVTAPGASESETARMETSFFNKFIGVVQAFRPWFTNTEVQVQQLSRTFDELKVLQLRDHVKDTMVSTPGIPPEAVGILKNSNRATITEAGKMLAKNVVIPRLERQRIVFQRGLIDPLSSELVLDYVSPDPDDQDQFNATVKSAPYAISVNEIRERVGLPSDGPEGDVRYINQSMLPIVEGEVMRDKGVDKGGRKDEYRSRYNRYTKVVLTPDEVDGILDLITEDQLIAGTIEPWSEHVANNVIAGLEEHGIAATMEIVNPIAIEWVDKYSTLRVKGITDGSREVLRKTLSSAIEEGLGIRDTSVLLRDEFGPKRAALIARTEIPEALNGSRLSVLKQAGFEYKTWLTAGDSRVRATHTLLHNRTIKIGETFPVGDKQMSYPNDFNERCTMIGSVDDKIKDTEGYVETTLIMCKGYSERKEDWIVDLLPRYLNIFQEQAELVIDAIEGVVSGS